MRTQVRIYTPITTGSSNKENLSTLPELQDLPELPETLFGLQVFPYSHV